MGNRKVAKLLFVTLERREGLVGPAVLADVKHKAHGHQLLRVAFGELSLLVQAQHAFDHSAKRQAMQRLRPAWRRRNLERTRHQHVAMLLLVDRERFEVASCRRVECLAPLWFSRGRGLDRRRR